MATGPVSRGSLRRHGSLPLSGCAGPYGRGMPTRAVAQSIAKPDVALPGTLTDNALHMQRTRIRPVKTATIPSLRVDPELRAAAEGVLENGESLSSFVEQSIRDGVQRRQAQREFIARGLKSRDSARRTKDYVPAEKVLERLEGMLEKSRRAAARK